MYLGFHLFTHMLVGAMQFPAPNSAHMVATATQNYCRYVPHYRHLRRYTDVLHYPFLPLPLPQLFIFLSMLNAQFRSQNLTLPLQSMSIKANFHWRRQQQFCCCLLLMAGDVIAFVVVGCDFFFLFLEVFAIIVIAQQTVFMFAPSSSLSSWPPLHLSTPLVLRLFDCLTAISIGLCHLLVCIEFVNLRIWFSYHVVNVVVHADGGYNQER